MRRRNKVFEGGMYDYGYSPYGVMVPILAHDGEVRLRLEGGLMLIHSPVGKPRGPKKWEQLRDSTKRTANVQRQNCAVLSVLILPGSGSSFTPPTLRW
eukprot:scaffold9347_cov135-Skeletonema_marinoi.AAC.1